MSGGSTNPMCLTHRKSWEHATELYTPRRPILAFGELMLLAAAMLAMTAQTCGAASPVRVVVPIQQSLLRDGTVRYSIPIRIGHSVPMQAMLDTGSTGIHVLSSALAAGDYSPTGMSSHYGYGSGVTMDGFVAGATVTIGDATTTEPIPIQVVQSLGCAPRLPHCPASRVRFSQYGFGGDGIASAGFKAIVGLSLWTRRPLGRTINPLSEVGDHQWIIELPEPGRHSGTLIINPDGQDLTGFTIFDQLTDLPGLQMKAIAGCLLNETTQRDFCGPMFFDTGAVPIIVWTSRVSPRRWGTGMQGDLRLLSGTDDRTGQGALSHEFTSVPERPQTTVLMLPQRGPRPVLISVGLEAFSAWSVFYDIDTPRMGVKPRD